MVVKYSPKALESLRSFAAYIRDDLHNPTAARDMLTNIRDKITLLEQFPELGLQSDAMNGLFCNVRFLFVDKYIVIYRILNDSILIETIVSSKTDYMQVLSDTITNKN